MKIKPVGHRLLIEQDRVKETTVGGIVVVTPDQLKKEQQAQIRGTVIAVGEDAWKEFKEPWCKVGDRVLYQRHSGMKITDEYGNFVQDYILLNDLDVTAVVTEEDIKHVAAA